MAWFTSPALRTLGDQVNALAPNRDKSSDGTIGDAAHSSRTSDHNPRPDGEVCARDFTHDPPRFDAHQFAIEVAASGDPRVKYVISNARIWSAARSAEGWRRYTGSNPHRKHAHISVQPDSSGAAWRLPMFGNPSTNNQEVDVTQQEIDAIVKQTTLNVLQGLEGDPKDPGDGYGEAAEEGSRKALGIRVAAVIQEEHAKTRARLDAIDKRLAQLSR